MGGGLTRALEDAERALEAVAADPSAARTLARSALDDATDDETRAVAWRALASAAQNLGQLDEAWRCVVASRRAARRCGVEERLVGATCTAVSIRLLQGRRADALRLLDEAEAAASASLRPDVLSQRAWVLWQVGRLRASVDVAAAALRHRPRPTPATVARIQINLGCCLADLGEHERADATLVAAAQGFRDLGAHHAALDAEFDRAVLAIRRGRIPEALRGFDEVADGLRRLGAPVGHVLVAEADALLAAHLTAEALVASAEAVESVEHGERFLAAVARLLHARASLAAGDPGALAAAEAAAEAWARVGDAGQVAACRHLLVQARNQPVDRRVVRELAGVAADLSRAGRRAEAVAAHADAVAAAARADVLGDVADSRRSLAEVRHRGSASERATAWYGEAVWRAHEGDASGATRAVRRGLDVLEGQRAMLGASELHAESAAHGAALAGLGVAIALGGGRPRDVLVAAERWRAGTLRRRPAPLAGLADQLAVLRRLQSDAAAAAEGGAATDDLVRQQANLEVRIRHLARLATGEAARPPAPDPAAVAAALDGRALVELVEQDGHLAAVVVSGARWRLHDLGPSAPALAALDHLGFALRRLGRPRSGAAAAAARHSALDALGALDRMLVAPFVGEVDGATVVVVPTADLHAVPWGALPSLRDRPSVVAPSSAWWAGSSDRGGQGEVLVAGPGLPGAAAEVAALTRRYPRATVLTGAAATAGAVATAVDGAALAHVAAHGHLRSDNPLFSNLVLADGPLTVYDLEHLRAAPRRVVLAACDTGVPAVRPGDELLGLVASLLSLGTGAVIASTVPVPDVDTAPMMVALHDNLVGGASMAEALHRARTSVDAETPEGLVVATAFSCFGAG